MLCAGYEDALDYRVGDAMAMDYADESVDALAFVYAHFPSAVRAELHPKLLRAVRPGGHVIVEVFGQRQLTYQPHHASGGPRDPDQLFTADDLRQLFEGCDVLELLEGEVGAVMGVDVGPVTLGAHDLHLTAEALERPGLGDGDGVERCWRRGLGLL